MQLHLTILMDTYNLYKLKSNSDIYKVLQLNEFYSMTKSRDEVSLICKTFNDKSSVKETSENWRILKVNGILDFSQVGIIAGLSKVLADKHIPILTLSTFNTDYIFVKENILNKAIETLQISGYIITYESTRINN